MVSQIWPKWKLQATQTQKITNPWGNYFTMHKGIVKSQEGRKESEEQTRRQPK